ncbi:MAG: sensor histidine kinase [Clostridiaceae bacterium]
MAIKLTGKKARSCILFLTLFLVVHILFNSFEVIEIVKEKKYSKSQVEKNFLVFDSIFESYVVDLYQYIVYQQEYRNSSLTEEHIGGLISDSDKFYQDNFSMGLVGEEKEQPKDWESAIKVLRDIQKYYESQISGKKGDLKSYGNLAYYFTDEKSNVYTNVEGDIQEYIKSFSQYYFNINTDNIVLNDGRMRLSFDDRYIIKGYIIIPKELMANSEVDAFVESMNNQIKASRTTLLIFSLEVLSVILLIFVIIKKKMYIQFKVDSDSLMKYYFKLNFEVRVFMILILTYIMFVLAECYFNTLLGYKLILITCYAIVLQLLFYIFLSYLFKSNDIRNRDKSIIYKFYSSFEIVKEFNKFFFKLFISLVATMILGSISIFMIQVDVPYGLGMPSIVIIILTIIFIIPLLIYIIKQLSKINNLIKSLEDISMNDLENNLNLKEDDELFNAYESIKNIKSSIESSVEERMKSERLKTELITNVSHDLKTPLTSIINYVDILRKNNLSQEDHTAYLEIIDKKSKRLKFLIEDLFEASKLSSGDIELNIEKVDLVSLIKQTLGEFEKLIEDSQLELILSLPKDKVYLQLDGKRTWRVFENILNNIIKYSQKGTRVYIELKESENQVVVTTKNISSYQLNVNPDELFEKFKRGDASRNTEGSGLGLSIARGILELHGGEMKIEVDGDLFKNILVFNK